MTEGMMTELAVRLDDGQEADEPPPAPAGEREWHYLATPAFQTRYVLAAHYLDDLDDIVEIGGYRTPITGFLRRPKRSVTVLDPRVAPLQQDQLLGQPCRVRHVPTLFQDFHDWPERYGLALLGLDFELYELTRRQRHAVLQQFEAVVRRADRIVVEIARDWPASRWLADWVQRTSGFHPTLRVTLTVEDPIEVDLNTSWPPIRKRTFRVLSPPGEHVGAAPGERDRPGAAGPG